MNTSEVNQEGNEDEKEEEPANLNLEPEHVVDALNKFEIVREKKALEELMGQSNKKKKVVKKKAAPKKETADKKAAPKKVAPKKAAAKKPAVKKVATEKKTTEE